MNQITVEIAEKAKKLDEAEKRFLKYIYETKKPENELDLHAHFKNLMQYATDSFQLKTEIQKLFIENPTITIRDPKVIDIIEKIKTGYHFYSISAYENIIDSLNKDREWFSKYASDIHGVLCQESSELLEEFHSRYDFINYYNEKITIGPLVVFSGLNPNILSYFEEIKEAFSHRLYRSSIALCRVLIEMSIFLKLNAKGCFKQIDSRMVSINLKKEDKLFKFIDEAKKEKILNGHYTEIAHDLRKRINRVLHLKEIGEVPSPKREEALEIVMQTTKVIEYLYRK